MSPLQATFVEEFFFFFFFKCLLLEATPLHAQVVQKCPERQRESRNVRPGLCLPHHTRSSVSLGISGVALEAWGVYLPLAAELPPRSLSRAVECGGRDPDLRPPRLESFVLRSLYGCVSPNAGPKSVFVPCLGSQWEGSRPRGYITLQRSASPNTTRSRGTQPSLVRVSGTDPGM